jgi:xylulokinase
LHPGESVASAVGSTLVAAFTASKVRWLADHEPQNADRIAAVALPHDWLTWKLSGSDSITDLATDRSDASGTGYFDPVTSAYRRDIFSLALRDSREVILPRILNPFESAVRTPSGIALGAGCGDNAGAALGVGAQPGDVVVSLGTSGTAYSVSKTSTHDVEGYVAGFADATGNYLPLVCTLNAAKILDAGSKILGLSLEQLGECALSAKAGAEGIIMLPYFDGERTPNRPNASGLFSGLTIANSTPENIARAMFEGMLCGLADAVHHLETLGVAVNRILIIGGAAKNPAVGHIASSLFGKPIYLPEPSEYVADGAAKQIAMALLGMQLQWGHSKLEMVETKPEPFILERYMTVVEQTSDWSIRPE